MNDTVKRYLISSITTFATGFLTVMLAALDSANTWTDVAWPAVILSASFVGVRLLLKALLEKINK